MNLQNKTIKLQKLMAEIKKYHTATMYGILMQGKNWLVIHDEKLWSGLESVKSFRHYINKETPFSHGTVYNYMDIAKFYENNENILNLSDSTRIITALPIIRKQISAIEDKDERMIEAVKDSWLHKAIVLNKNDYEEEIRISKGQISQEDCNHKNIRTIKVCKNCNKKLEVEDM